MDIIEDLFFLLEKEHITGPFAARGHIVQNLTYWRAKECDKTPLENVNKEKAHFFSHLCYILESGTFFALQYGISCAM